MDLINTSHLTYSSKNFFIVTLVFLELIFPIFYNHISKLSGYLFSLLININVSDAYITMFHIENFATLSASSNQFSCNQFSYSTKCYVSGCNSTSTIFHKNCTITVKSNYKLDYLVNIMYHI